LAAQKNDILFERFEINYNNEPEMFRKGSVIYREVLLFCLSKMHELTKCLLALVCNISDPAFRAFTCAIGRRRAAADLEDTEEKEAEEVKEDERDC